MRRNDVEAGTNDRSIQIVFLAPTLRHFRNIIASQSLTTKPIAWCMESTKHEIVTCPCCKGLFECRSGTIANCQCADVLLSAQARELLSIQFGECLCKHCLAEVEKETRNVGNNNVDIASSLGGTNFAINK